MLPNHIRSSSWRYTQICSLHDLSRCCCSSWSACGHVARLAAMRCYSHRYWYCCRQVTITPRPFPSTANLPAAECTRLYGAQLCTTVECTRLGSRAASREMCRHVFHRFSITPISAFATTSRCSCCCCRCCRGVRTAMTRNLIHPLARHAPRVRPTAILPQRGFSGCCSLSF